MLLNQEDYRNRRVIAILDVTTKDGRHFQERVELTKGDPGDPLTRDELVEKFRDLAVSVALPKHKIDAILKLVTNLESLDDISELGKLLCP
jgi:2-methylcitrate dehydratase PrpD